MFIDETRVCVPDEPAFQTWVASIDDFSGRTCGEELTDDQRDRYRETWQGLGGEASPAGSETAADVGAAGSAGFTDQSVDAGATPLKAAHFRELRSRIAALRTREGLPAVQWTDPTLTAGVTPVKRVHLTELRAALDAVYDAVGRARPNYSDATLTAGITRIRAVHLTELRAAVTALE